MTSPFESLLDHDVKVVFHDGNNIRVQRGKLVSTEDGFATLSTQNGIVAIRIFEIVKIRESGGIL